jgi:hypothetical protein
MKRYFLPFFIAAAICSASASAQEKPEWRQRRFRDEDFLNAKVHERFVFALDGKFLKGGAFLSERPVLVISCSDGKVEKNYFSLRGFDNLEKTSVSAPAGGPTSLEARVDDKKTTILVDGQSGASSFFFPRRDLKKLLKAHQVIIGAKYLGSQVVMQFDIPDPAPVLAGCAQDRVLNDKK